MDLPTRLTAGLALAIVASLAAAPAQAGAEAPAAGDEYVLELPGVRQSEGSAAGGGGEGIGPVSRTDSRQLGVVGETDAPASPLAASAEAAGAIPTSLLAGLAALVALALATVTLRLTDARRRP
ncbi:MAG: hypothetical protein EDQ89_03170 [Acidobacteria bacterium]|nr:MAG: hypothetical protein EDQ89_03170 [Acidobacteriota bacterium]MCL4288078.1 hypothetical protein [Thermoleophilia bacterium]GIK77001.1 MAG: hypothetical protein BroJett022_06910 [Actinomycetes bacterium]